MPTSEPWASQLARSISHCACLNVAGNYYVSNGWRWEKILHQVSLKYSTYSAGLREPQEELQEQCLSIWEPHSVQIVPELPSVLHFRIQKLLPSKERELWVHAGIHFEKVIWRTACEPESLWVLLSLGKSFLCSQNAHVSVYRNGPRYSGAVNQHSNCSKIQAKNRRVLQTTPDST